MSLPGEGVGFLPMLVKGNLGKHISRRRDLALAGAGGQRGELTNRKGGPRAYGWRTPSFSRFWERGADGKPGRCPEDEVRAGPGAAGAEPSPSPSSLSDVCGMSEPACLLVKPGPPWLPRLVIVSLSVSRLAATDDPKQGRVGWGGTG